MCNAFYNCFFKSVLLITTFEYSIYLSLTILRSKSTVANTVKMANIYQASLVMSS